MYELPDPSWYLDNVLVHAEPGPPRRLTRRATEEWQQWWEARIAPLGEDGFVLSSSDRDRLGVTRSRARNEIRRGRWTAAGYGCVSPISCRESSDGNSREADLLELRRRHVLAGCAATRRRPYAVISGRSAAIVHGLPTMSIPRTPELTEGFVGQGRRTPAHLYAATLNERETVRWHGVAVESVERTLVTLARHGRRDAIMAADLALRDGLVDRDDISRALDTAFGWPWVRQARAVLALADPRAESPLESITRLALHDSDFPQPQLQVVFGTDRVDFYLPGSGLVIEADGAGKYVGDAWIREKRRERRLLRYPEVCRIERVVWSDIVDTWLATHAALRRHVHPNSASHPRWS